MQSTIIVKKEYKTGDFGSFDGQFTIPEHILPGMISIQTELGSITIQVSEYKTPTLKYYFIKQVIHLELEAMLI